MSDNFSDDIAERADEIEALSAIFEDSMAVNSDDNSVSEWKFPWQIFPYSWFHGSKRRKDDCNVL